MENSEQNSSIDDTFRIELDSELFEIVNRVIESNGNFEDPRVPYVDSAQQYVEIAGESNYQDALSRYKLPTQTESWANGILIPEPENRYDPNAVRLFLINDDYRIDLVGYVTKELASLVSSDITKLQVAGKILPVKCLLIGGDETFPTIGIKAWVKSDVYEIPDIPNDEFEFEFEFEET